MIAGARDTDQAVKVAQVIFNDPCQQAVSYFGNIQ